MRFDITIGSGSGDVEIDYIVFSKNIDSVNDAMVTGISIGDTAIDGFASDKEYVDLLKLVYQKVKSINPKARVYAFATANVSKNVAPPEFIENCLKLGAGDYFDSISLHPYNVTLSPEHSKFSEDIDDVVDVMNKYGIGHKDIVLSEFGWTSGKSYANEELQANYTTEMSALMHEKVSKVVWYNLQEKSLSGMSDGELHFGFIRGWNNEAIPFEAKPVMLTYSAYNALMKDVQKTGKLDLSDENASVYTFKTEDGQNVQTTLH